MLTAKYKDTIDIIDITKIKNPRAELDKKKLVCRFCDSAISIRQGMIRSKHFFHLSQCTCDFGRHAESAEHNLAKELVANHVKENWSDFSEVDIQYEYPLSEIKRIADIAMIFPSGWLVIHEIQLSAITNEELQKRTEDYNAIGADVIWWLGKSADKSANQKWCLEKYGYSLSLDYDVLKEQSKHLQIRSNS